MAKLVYQRSNGKWEARYKKGVSEKGKILYGTVYGNTKEEAIRRREEVLGYNPEAPIEHTRLNLLILGAGTHGKDVKDIAEGLRVFNKIAFLDDHKTGEDIIGKCKDALKYKSEYPCAFIAIGNNKIRKKYAKLLKDCKFLIPNIISPSATISPNAVIGEGVVVMPQSTIGSSTIGDFAILASNCLVNSNSKLGDYVHIDCGGIVLKDSKVDDGTQVKSGEIYKK